MHVVGLDHIVVNTQDMERAMHFYHELLGLELLRLEEFRAEKDGFVSARISPEMIIDIRPIAAGERVTPEHGSLLPGAQPNRHAPPACGAESSRDSGRGHRASGMGCAGLW